MTQFTVAMRRWGPAPVVMLVAMAALMALSTDATAKKTPAARQTVETAPREAGEPIMAIVSIKSQRVTFYDADGWIMRAPVSTGTKGRETPAGVFALIEKDKDHHSTMYDDAWMPNMQRITWNGIALHGGPLPGYAASHGCIRMPYGFAETMFDKTWIGMRVIISPNDATPVDLSHPALFQPNAEALAAAPARAETLGSEAADAATAADDAKKAAKTAVHDSASATALVRKLEKQNNRVAARLAAADKAIAAADKAKARGEDLKQKAAAMAADLATQLDAIQIDAKQKALADAKLASADKAIAAADQAKARAEEAKQKAAIEATDLASQLDTARTDATSRGDAAAAAKVAAKEADAGKAVAAKAASEAKLALVPVSVYISRATQMLYVRRNTHKPWPDGGEVFNSSIEVPITIRDPDKPIGTHIFTAMASNNDGTLRWSAVTIEGADNAADALDRITIPPDVLDRIAPTALPRSSIVISDEPLSKETNYRTEFVAVLSDYPQGGFITRTPSANTRIVKDNGGFFSLFPRNSGKSGRSGQWDWLQPPRR